MIFAIARLYGRLCSLKIVALAIGAAVNQAI